MIDYFTLVSAFVTRTETVVFASGLIVLWAIGSYAYFSRQMNPVIRELRRLRRMLDQYEGEADFAADYESLRETLTDNAFIGHEWQEFTEVLYADTRADPPVMKNAQSPGAYFSRNRIVAGRVNLRLWNTLPNLLTGLGILGTFIGLVAGIHLASSGLGSGDPDQLHDALENLLAGASLAFITSVAGLFSSLGFNIGEKRKLHKLDKEVGQWVGALDRCLRQITVAWVADEQLVESRRQSEALEQLGTALVMELSDTLAQRVQQDLGPTFERLVNAVEGMSQKRSDDNTEVLRQMAGEFQESLTGSAGKQLAELGDAVRVVTEQLQTASTRTGEQLEVMAERLQRTIQSVEQVLQQAGITAEQNQKIAQSNQETIASLEQAGTHFGELAEPIAQSVQAIEQSAGSLKESSGQMLETQHQAGTIVDAIRQIQEQLQESWASYESRFGEVDTQLANAFRELGSGLSQYTSTVNEFVGELDAHTASVTQNLAGAVSELREALEETQDAVRELRPA